MLLSVSLDHLIVSEVYSFKLVEFIRKRVPKMSKVKDIRNLFNSQKEADTLALIASATDDDSQPELLIVENKIKK